MNKLLTLGGNALKGPVHLANPKRALEIRAFRGPIYFENYKALILHDL